MKRATARGATLVELMVSLTIGLLVAGVVATMFASNARTFAFTSSVGELQDSGRVAFDLLQRDLRMAGFHGCDGGSPPAPLRVESTGGSDSLELRVPAGEALALAEPMRDADAALRLAPSAEVRAGDLWYIGDCSASAAFRATAAGPGRVGHVLDGGGHALPRAFGSDALLLRLVERRYVVAPEGEAAGAEGALWRIDAGRAPQLVARHVQALRVQLGIDSDGDGVANRYLRGAEATSVDLAHVVAVQFELLVRGEVAARSVATSAYVFDGRRITPADGRMYRVYSATLPLWNRAT